MAFLMPATSVRRRFNQVVNDSGDFHIADLCRLSHFYFVSLEAMTLRLEGLSLIPKGVRDHLKESRFEVRRASEMLNLQQHPASLLLRKGLHVCRREAGANANALRSTPSTPSRASMRLSIVNNS
jgi:Zn-dependent peptidase ImmA (M78 family)